MARSSAGNAALYFTTTTPKAHLASSSVQRIRIFIGSSTESLHIAEALQAAFDGSRYEVMVWEDAFAVGGLTIEQLRQAARDNDFGVFVFGPDDQVITRGTIRRIPRDNVLFEAGMFSYRRGPTRAFIVTPADGAVKTPTDLDGVVLATFHAPQAPPTERRRWRSALRPCANLIEETIENAVAIRPVPTVVAQERKAQVTSELDGIRSDSEAARVELLRFRNAVDRATFGGGARFTEDVDSTFLVGKDDTEDSVSTERRTVPDPGNRISWRRVVFGSDVASLPRDDVLQFRCLSRGKPLETIQVRDLEREGEWVVLFSREIEPGEVVVWKAEYNWPGFWAPLRAGEVDFAYLDLPFAGKVVMRFLYPRERRLNAAHTSHEGVFTRGTRGDFRVLTWKTGRIEPGRVRIGLTLV